MKVDMHNHFIPREFFDMVDEAGRPFGPKIQRDRNGDDVIVVDGVSLGALVPQVTDPDVRIRDMDRLGIDIQAISINKSRIFNDLEIDRAMKLYQGYNDAFSQIVSSYPDRFVALATIPMQDVPAAIAELERSIRTLGLHGVQIGTNVNGKNLDDLEFRPLFKKIEELNVPILLHPYYVAAAERMRKYWLVNLIGNPMDTTIAIASLIFGGVLEEFPNLRIVCAHGGGAAPYIHGRMQHGYNQMEECHSVPRSPNEYLGQLYFDSLTHSDIARSHLVQLVGAEHVVLGSDYPFQMGDADPIRSLRATNLSQNELEMILENTGEDVLQLS